MSSEALLLEPLPQHEVLKNRATWIAALRSSVYPQARGSLRTVAIDGKKIGFCCLGVAEDVRGCAWGGHGGGGNYYVADRFVRLANLNVTMGSNDAAIGKLTGQTAHWLGLHTTNPYVAYNTPHWTWTVSTLVELNDTARLSLAQIADVIEEQPAEWNGTVRFVNDDIHRRTGKRSYTS